MESKDTDKLQRERKDWENQRMALEYVSGSILCILREEILKGLKLRGELICQRTPISRKKRLREKNENT